MSHVNVVESHSAIPRARESTLYHMYLTRFYFPHIFRQIFEELIKEGGSQSERDENISQTDSAKSSPKSTHSSTETAPRSSSAGLAPHPSPSPSPARSASIEERPTNSALDQREAATARSNAPTTDVHTTHSANSSQTKAPDQT